MRLVVCLVALGLAGCTCGSDATQGVQIPHRVVERPPSQEKRKYDARGDLLESANRIEGLPMPEGLGEGTEFQGTKLFRTHLPIDRVARYFGQRLMTPTIEKRGKGAVFRSAKYTKGGEEFAEHKYTVSVLPGPGVTLVSVTVAKPYTGKPVDPKELADKYQELLERGQ